MMVARFLTIFISSILLAGPLQAMTTLEGQPTHIDHYKNNSQWLIVQAWNSSCSICNETAPDLVKVAYKLPNAKLIGVSLDANLAATKRFIKQHKINFPTLLSSNNEFNTYLEKIANEGLTGTPTYLIFNPQGRLVGMQAGTVEPMVLHNFLTDQQKG